jgi:glycosyltransferase involved in cell wall biosynthesis
MRIAQIAPPWYPVPPPGYGGIERVVALLADGLAERGHEVTLYASGGSDTKAELVSPMSDPPDPATVGNAWFDTYHALASYLHLREGDFDVVHDHSGVAGPALGAMLRGAAPVVHTLHGPWTHQTRLYYSLLQHHVHVVAISEAQKSGYPDLAYAGVVHNGIPLADYPFQPDKHDFLVYIGRATPDKGPALAIEVARRVGLPLAMVVKRNEPSERTYWDEKVAPFLSQDVEVFEGISQQEKADLLGRAKAMVFPLQWPEPFGLVMVEAMACGTPVVACPAGAATELIEDGVTGYLRNSIEELVMAVVEIDRCSPIDCRQRVETHFSADAMVRGYEELFQRFRRPPT